MLNHALDRSLDGGRLGDVERDGDRLVAMARLGFLSVGKGNVGDGDPRSLGDTAIGDRSPNAASAAGNERDFVLELHD
jgi:hypothetical protein